MLGFVTLNSEPQSIDSNYFAVPIPINAGNDALDTVNCFPIFSLFLFGVGHFWSN